MIDLGINLFQEIAALGGGGAFSITNSLRFNDDDSAYLSRTPSVAGNRKTWTWSGWVKRGNISTQQKILNTRKATNVNPEDLSIMEFTTGNAIRYASYGSSVEVETTAILGDSSGWYHIVFVFDSTEATSTNRIKIYVNGVQLTAFTTYTAPTLNQDSAVNNTELHTIGGVSASQNIDGYLADIYLIDGQALTADDFGEIDATTGEWSPIEYSGTYGTNGFYLAFDGNTNDSSGNGNNWTENNLASTDYMIDTPDNNFSVLNPLASDEVTFQEGNLEATLLTTNPRSAITTIPVSSGKWYAEVYYNSNTINALVAGVVTDSYSPVSDPTRANKVSSGGGSVGYFLNDGDKFIDDVRTAYGSIATTGDIIGIAFNLDDDEITFYKNNVSQGTITTKAFSGGYNFFLSNNDGTGNQVATLNQGADSSFAGNKTRQGNTDANGIGDFYYAPPTGFLALCTDNTSGSPLASVT